MQGRDGREQVRIKKALILGDPNSIFSRELAEILPSYGIEVGIVTGSRLAPEGSWPRGQSLADGTAVLDSSAYETPLQQRGYFLLQQRLGRLESVIIKRQRDRYERAMRGDQWCRPRFTPAVVDGLSIARLVRSIRPNFVVGEEASTYGLATAWCQGIPRILIPWGGDIFMYCDTTTFASRVVTHALRGLTLWWQAPRLQSLISNRGSGLSGLASIYLAVGGSTASSSDARRAKNDSRSVKNLESPQKN